MKSLLIKIRTSVKFLILIGIAIFLIVSAVIFFYKPIYSVTLNDELVGYCAQKSKLQEKIEDYIETGDGDNENVAFVEVNEMPKYELCLLKRGKVTNDEEIFEKIKQTGTTYYRYYTILEENEEKLYVADFEAAEGIITELKNKNSDNIDKIQIQEKYETNMQDFVTTEEAVASLYKEKVVEKPVTVAKTEKKTTTKASSGSASGFSTSINLSKASASLGISLIKPINGIISSRFGAKSGIRSGAHTGLDIAASAGTPIKAAAGGTVTWSGVKGSYGNMVVITHSNGVQTYYGHCSKLYVSAGQTVSQGQTIAAVGSTGNSTGPHLHLEIRINGVAYNPQNYLY